MTLPRYLFFTDQGQVFSVAVEPTKEDFAFAEIGMRIIVRVADNHFFGRAGKWLPVPAGELGESEIEGEDHGPFHGPGGDFGEYAMRN